LSPKKFVNVVVRTLLKYAAESDKGCSLQSPEAGVPKRRRLIQKLVNRLAVSGHAMHRESRIEKLSACFRFSPKYLKFALKSFRWRCHGLMLRHFGIVSRSPLAASHVAFIGP
jgi:hypothetical protein